MIMRFWTLILIGFLTFCQQGIGSDVLKERQPNWRPKILSSYPRGELRKVLFYAPDSFEDVDIPVREVMLFQNGQPQGERDVVVLSQDDPVAKQLGTTVVPHGYSVTYWPNGKLEKFLHYNKGCLDGDFLRYNERAVLIEKGRYREGRLEGIFERFYPDGEKSYLANYVGGLLDGEAKEWFPNGTVKSVRYYASGLLNGDRQKPAVRVYDENQQVIETLDFRLGCPCRVVEGKVEFLPLPESTQVSAIPTSEDVAIFSSADLETKIPDGEWKVYYPLRSGENEGEVKLIISYKDGKPHGIQKTFYPNGQMETLVSYNEGLLHGQKARWSSQGELLEQALYENGDLNGRYYQKKNEGTLVISHYKNHRLHGLEQIYYPSRNADKVKAREATYVNGLLDGELALYNKSGIKVASSLYVGGKREGISTAYSSEGRVVMTAEYRNDKKNGVACEFFPNGNIHQQTPFQDDLEHGEEKVFFDNGKLAAVRSFCQGKLTGAAKEWSKEGTLVFEAEYVEGKRHGLLRKYDEENSRWIVQVYDNDKLLRGKGEHS